VISDIRHTVTVHYTLGYIEKVFSWCKKVFGSVNPGFHMKSVPRFWPSIREARSPNCRASCEQRVVMSVGRSEPQTLDEMFAVAVTSLDIQIQIQSVTYIALLYKLSRAADNVMRKHQ